MMVMADTDVRGRLLINASMARYSSWRAGGRAAQLFIPADMKDLVKFITALEPQVALYFVGLGSNLLVRDGGLDGVIVRLAPGLTSLSLGEPGIVRAQAGVAAPKLARFATSCQLGELAFMVGIPGSVGGALAMNAGCYGSTTWQFVHQVTLLTRAGELLNVPAYEFKAGYRCVSHPDYRQALFVEAKFKLDATQSVDTDTTEQIMREREKTQPIGTANAGSVFVNPPNESAGRLIESAGLAGYQIGAAQISPMHCNFIVNLGGASAADIENLIEHARSVVFAKFAIELKLEVKILGKKS